MKRLLLIITLSCSTSGALAYSIHGDSDNGFVLKCKDGTTNTSVMPPNHNTAVAFCEDHGGIAAGYPKPVGKNARAKLQAPDDSSMSATSHNASRSNKSR